MVSFLDSFKSQVRVERCVYCAEWLELEKDDDRVHVVCTRRECVLKEARKVWNLKG